MPADLQDIVRLFGNDKDTVDSVLTALRNTLDQRSASRGTGGTVRIQLNGNIDTQGAGSYGLFAQSGFQKADGMLDPGRPGGDIAVDYSGVLQGGSDGGAAIVVDGGKRNSIVINPGSHISARSGSAIISTFGQESVRNFGMLAGDADLARGDTKEWNGFRNEAGGTYISGGAGTIKLGSGGGRFHNAGRFDVGGVGKMASANVEGGDLVLDGVLLVDVNSLAAPGTPDSDRLQGSKIIVDGVEIRPHAVEGLLPGSDFTVVSATALETNRPATAWAGMDGRVPMFP